MIFNHTDYRLILRDHFATRCQQNPRYSLRAYSRDLEILPSKLSEVLNRKQGLSVTSAMHISDKLQLNKDEREYFRLLVESEHARSGSQREIAKIRLKKFKQTPTYKTVELDVFKVISDWYHFAILELTNIQGFRSEPGWIAKQLEVSEVEVTTAIDRLKRVQLLVETPDGLKSTEQFPATPSGIPSDAIKSFHKQILQKAQSALVTQDVEQRDFATILMPINTKKLASIKGQLKHMRRRVEVSAKSESKKDALYCLSVQFFRVNQRSL